jgi:hypothetical protein
MIYITVPITNLYKKTIADYPDLNIKNGGIIDKEINLLTYNHTGLGNNLFQISNCLITAWKHNIETSFPDLRLLTQKLPDYPMNIYKHLCQKEFKYRIKYPNLNTNELNNCIIEIENKMFTYINLINFEQKLKNIFSVDQISLNQIKNKYPNLFENNITVSMHVRRGDFVVISELYNPEYILKDTYYHKAIKYIKEKIKTEFKLLIFSDDIEWCKNNFKNDNIIFIEHNFDYIDLWIMSQCNHNIISSSTFSWWGAFLNNNLDKIIIAPQKSVFREKKNFIELNKNLYPPEWIIIEE